MATIKLPTTLTAAIEQVGYDRAGNREVFAVVLRFGTFGVKEWRIDESKRRSMEVDGSELDEFVADRLAVLFSLGGCSCGPGA